MEFLRNFNDIKGDIKEIAGFDEYYVTEFGEIYSTKPIGIGKEHKLHKITPKNPGKDSKYYNVMLCKDGKTFTKSIHRLVAEHFVDGYFDGAVVNHIDGDNRNNIASNLEWTTIADNVHKSYVTSGMGPKRNCMEWTLVDSRGDVVGIFHGCNDAKKYIINNNLEAKPEQLVKNGSSRGYRLIKGRIENCNDYPNGVAAG